MTQMLRKTVAKPQHDSIYSIDSIFRQ